MAQLNDLIVTGAARFLNTINGKITNAATADYATNAGTAGSANAVAWANVSGKPTTFAPIVGSASTQAAAGNHNHDGTYYKKTDTVSNATNASSATYATTAGSANAVAWGNVSSKPATGIATSTGTNQLTMTANTKYALGAAGSTYIFTTPPNPTSVTNATSATYATNAGTATYATTAGSANAVAWANVSGKPSTYAPVIGSGSTQAAAGNHTHTFASLTSKPTTISGFGITDFKSVTTSAIAPNSSTVNEIGYTNATSAIYGQSDGALFVQAYSAAWVAQIYQDYRTGHIAVRGNNNSTWTEWGRVFDTRNVSGANGITINSTTAGITIGGKPTNASTADYATSAGTAGSANAVAWGNVSGKPSTYPPTTGSGSTQAAPGNHTHGTAIATSTGTNQLTMAANTKYALGAGGTTYIFTTPPNPTSVTNATSATYATNAGTATYATSAGSAGSATSATSATNASTADYAKAAPWSGISSKPSTYAPIVGSGSTQAAAGNHTHTTTIATSTGTNQLTMAANTKYALGAGGTTYIFTTPPNPTSVATATNSSTADYAKAAPWSGISSKPSTYAPIVGNASTQAAAGNHNHDGTYYKKTDTVSNATNASSATYATTAVGVAATCDFDFGEL